MMSFMLWTHEFFKVWQVSLRAVIVPAVVVMTLWSMIYAINGFLAVVVVLPVALWGYAHAHRKGYEAVHAAGGVRLPMRQWWWRVYLGSTLPGTLMMLGAVLLMLSSVEPLQVVVIGAAAMALLMPYIYFMMVDGLGPVRALNEDLRLVQKHPISVIVLGGLIFVLQAAMGFAAWYLTLRLAAETMLMDTSLVTLGLGLGLFSVKLGMFVFGMSLQVAGAITIYRVVKGKVGAAAPRHVVA